MPKKNKQSSNNNLPYVILLNGPPGSGKDTAAQIIAKRYNAIHLKFKDSLIDTAAQYYNVDPGWLRYVCEARELKDESSMLLKQQTPRQTLIHVAEDVIKPSYGEDFFAKQVLSQIDEPGMYVISDLGFYEEISTIGCAIKDVLTLVISRTGHSYKSDSRHTIECSEYSAIEHIVNNDTIDTFKQNVLEAVKIWLKEKTYEC